MNLENIYDTIKEAKKAFNQAKTEEEKTAAREKYHKICAEVDAAGPYASRIFNELMHSKNNGNELLDINDVVWDKDAPELIKAMKLYGIKAFTFSSGWSHAVVTAWRFQEAGAKLVGLVQINGSMNWDDEEHEKIPAYKFTLD